ncbi:MAG TPA: glycosyltransferase family 2 protein [Ktedonobacterales bacterium]
MPVWVRTWSFRLWVAGATFVLCAVLLWLQDRLGAVPLHPTRWQTLVQWSELIWLCPVPAAAAIWLGWVIFAAAARPAPRPVAAPRLRRTRSAAPLSVRLVFRIPTRGDNVAVLRDAVAAVHEAFARYSEAAGPYRIEIVSERPVALGEGGNRTHIYAVPADYTTRHRSRFKARALAYLQSRVQLEARDWCVYLDEESLVDTAFLAGVYRYVQRHSPGGTRREQQRPCPIGQGAILYQGGNWFFRGADALRTADDLGRFRLQYALGVPLFGIHGSYIVVRGVDDAGLSFDVGARNSLTEDAAWSLRAWARGRRFAWVDGYLYEQPPQTATDFVRQRARWLAGIRRVLRDGSVPLRYRLCLGLYSLLWQLSFLPFLIAIAAVVAHVAPFGWMRLAADFAWASYVLAYVIGADRAAARRRDTAGHSPLDAPSYVPRWLRPVWRPALRATAWVLALAYLWYALLEAAGVFWSLMVGHDFFVIRKPSLTHASETGPVKLERAEKAKALDKVAPVSDSRKDVARALEPAGTARR